MEVIVVKTQEEGAKQLSRCLNVPIMKGRKYLVGNWIKSNWATGIIKK